MPMNSCCHFVYVKLYKALSRAEEFVTADNVAGYYDGACLSKMLMGD